MVKIVTAKPEAAVLQTSKLSHSQKLNAVSSTAKPDILYKSLLDYNNQQQGLNQQQYIPQQIVQQPLRLQQIPVQHQQQIAAQQLAQHSHQIAQQAQQSQSAALPALHPQAQQQILQFVQRALYTSQQQHQPTAMIIIAQPALVPASALYGNGAQQQQLYNYVQAQQQPR